MTRAYLHGEATRVSLAGYSAVLLSMLLDFALFDVAPAHGARLWAERSDGMIVPMGGEAPAGPFVLRVRLPQAADVRVVCDGGLARELHGDVLDVDIDGRGVYRIEARIDERLWLLSNCIHLR